MRYDYYTGPRQTHGFRCHGFEPEFGYHRLEPHLRKPRVLNAAPITEFDNGRSFENRSLPEINK